MFCLADIHFFEFVFFTAQGIQVDPAVDAGQFIMVAPHLGQFRKFAEIKSAGNLVVADINRL